MLEEGQNCPECNKALMKFHVENCSCHISPPCSSCTDAPLMCQGCGYTYEFEREVYKSSKTADYSYMPYGRKSRVADLGDGKKLLDFEYDSSSGSTMVYRGKIEGNVTPKDILDYFGSGTFGHRGPSILGNSFTFTKITD